MTGQPKLQTQVSVQQTRPGASIRDKVVVSGVGALALPVQVELFGPFQTRAAIACSGTPYSRSSLVARGDGTYLTAPVRIDKAGYYTYRESIAANEAWSAAATACAEVAETTFAHARPEVSTIASNEVVVPGASIYDRVRVRGLGKTAARIRVELFGPFSSRAQIRCSGSPYAAVTVTAEGDGELRTPGFRLAKAGFYTFRERLLGSALVAEFTTRCAVVAETSLARPEIVTGRGDVSRSVLVRADGSRPGPGADRIARNRRARVGGGNRRCPRRPRRAASHPPHSVVEGRRSTRGTSRRGSDCGSRRQRPLRGRGLLQASPGPPPRPRRRSRPPPGARSRTASFPFATTRRAGYRRAFTPSGDDRASCS